LVTGMAVVSLNISIASGFPRTHDGNGHRQAITITITITITLITTKTITFTVISAQYFSFPFLMLY